MSARGSASRSHDVSAHGIAPVGPESLRLSGESWVGQKSCQSEENRSPLFRGDLADTIFSVQSSALFVKI